MSSGLFAMKLNDNDKTLMQGLMAKHKLKERSDLVRRALAYFESAPMTVDPVLDAISRLKPFLPTEAQLQRHREAKRRVDAGERGLNKADSLALLDSLHSRGRARPKAARKEE